ENDTAILGREATLEDNIELLRKVLKTQNRLIRETVSEDLDSVPRQIVLFTEVEEFFYGNEKVPGLMGDPELEGVTLMLSDNNHGSTRTLPSEAMRNHKGGYGMYYHMDMHGGAHSFQWIGSTYLPKLWEQMTMAYEYGVREIWVTNIGDIGTQEFGLSYFLSLAYDIEAWGGRDAAVTTRYTGEWLHTQFGQCFREEELERLKQVFLDYTGLLARRKHEVMNEKVYHPLHFGEAEEVLRVSQSILDTCDELKAKCPERMLAAFISLVYYPACGTANLMKLWILTGRNHLYAAQNRIAANALADRMSECFERDAALTEEYHTVENGYFYGFGLSEHIGFTNWNEDDNKYPIRMYVQPANHSRMLVARVEDEHYSTGLPWTDKKQRWSDCLRPDVDRIVFEIACGSREPVSYRIENDCPWMEFSSEAGVVYDTERIVLSVRRERFRGRVKGSFAVLNEGGGRAEIEVEAENPAAGKENAFWERDGYIAIEAAHFQESVAVSKGEFLVLKPYGRTGSAIKVFPVTADFLQEPERPYVEYRFIPEQEGNYRLRFYMAATTPVVYERKQYIGFSVNGGELRIVNTVEKEEEQFFLSEQWSREAYNHIKLLETVVECKPGVNTLRFYGMSPAIVLERLLLYPEGTTLPESYLGPRESYYR
ncbi:MAG: glycosyl hydrolase 115 family protein, partial [Lachnospiraceae bacterium]